MNENEHVSKRMRHETYVRFGIYKYTVCLQVQRPTCEHGENYNIVVFFGLARVVDDLGASEPDCSTHSHSCQSEQSYRWLGAALNGGGGGGGDDVCVPLTCVYATQY